MSHQLVSIEQGIQQKKRTYTKQRNEFIWLGWTKFCFLFFLDELNTTTIVQVAVYIFVNNIRMSNAIIPMHS